MEAIENTIVSYGLKRSPPSCERLAFYEEFFERHFLTSTEQHLKTAVSLTPGHDAMSGMYEYMLRAKKVLENEEQLCSTYLCKKTVDRMLKLLRIAFVLNQLEQFSQSVNAYITKQSKKGT